MAPRSTYTHDNRLCKRRAKGAHWQGKHNKAQMTVSFWRGKNWLCRGYRRPALTPSVASFLPGMLTTTCSELDQRPTSTAWRTATTLVAMPEMLSMASTSAMIPATSSTRPTTACSSVPSTRTTTSTMATVLCRTAPAGGWTDVMLHIWTADTTRVRARGQNQRQTISLVFDCMIGLKVQEVCFY